MLRVIIRLTLLLYRFTPALAALHNKLTTLRRSAKELERSLQDKYELPSLTLKIVQKYGPAAHVQLKAKSATDKIDADPAATVLTGSGSTRSYSIGVRPSRALMGIV